MINFSCCLIRTPSNLSLQLLLIRSDSYDEKSELVPEDLSSFKKWWAEKREVFCSLSKISSSDVTEIGLFEFVEFCAILGRQSSVFIGCLVGT